MRGINFKGKSVVTGEWIYGFIVNDLGKSYLIDEIEVSNDYGDGTDLYAIGWDEVVPESIGQYIGFRDKNGKKIYEGDVVKTMHHIIKTNEKMYSNTVVRDIRQLEELYYSDEQEVIGNVYESPFSIEGELT